MMILIISLTTIFLVIQLLIWVMFRNFLPNIANNQDSKYQNTDLEKLLVIQKATLESSRDGILILDNCNRIIGFNQSFLKIWGIPEFLIKSGNCKQALRMAIKKLENPRYYLKRLREIDHNTDIQIYDTLVFKDGRIFNPYYQTQKIGQNNIGKVWSFQDITAEKMVSSKIKNYALHDLLTNLPNRVLFNNILIKSLEENSNNHNLAVCFLDLNRFKKINDSLSHGIGDKLLKMVALRLQECLRPGDIIARWGGDEFSILLREINVIEDVILIQERILAAFRKGFKIDNHHINLSLSIGIAVSPQHGINAEILIKNADTALSRAKLERVNYYKIYQPTINSHNAQTSELFILEHSLYNALERGEFKVYYQPQINSFSGKITQMEALLRWEHPELGLISPGKFIPIAEETGLIVPISEWVLKTACLQNKIWQKNTNLHDLSIAVNFSVQQFQQPNLIKMIEQILAETKLKSKYLELEITETVAMQDVELTRKTLKELKKIGVTISIDDFGTGYSSLSHLKDFPVNSLKIDQSFVRDLVKGDHHTAITTAIISLAHELNLIVVAEGVETEEQFNWLKVMKCEVMQGYLFSHPLSAEEATRMLKLSKPYKLKNSCLFA